MTMTLIETKTLGAAASSIEFTSIPQDGTDLLLLVSPSNSTDLVETRLRFNSDTGSNYTTRRLYGSGSSVARDTSSTTYLPFLLGNATSFTANTFGNGAITIPNYRGSTAKSVSADTVSENNGTESYQNITAGLWNSTAAITSILILPPSGNLLANTTASLYKVTNGSDGIVTTS
jgi:hypothetical protein